MGGAASILDASPAEASEAFAAGEADLSSSKAEIARLRGAVSAYAAAAGAEEGGGESGEIEAATALVAASEARWDAASGDNAKAACAEAVLLRAAIAGSIAAASSAAPVVEATSSDAEASSTPSEAAPTSVLACAIAHATVAEGEESPMEKIVFPLTEQLDARIAAAAAKSDVAEAEEARGAMTCREFLASRLHDVWRVNRGRTKDGSGRFVPREKTLADGTVVDIANMRFHQLPVRFRRANVAAGQVAIDAIEDQIERAHDGGWGIRSPEFIESASSLVHDVWMEMNRAWAEPALLVPFDELPEEEKEKDRSILREALVCWRLYYPDNAEAADLADTVSPGGPKRRRSIVQRAGDAIKGIFASNPDAPTFR
jgi:hypothetical protein|tara:strand:+ start:91 stop:1206 length:1116 start_codon:yes stop_codon:yes gene_type:complete